MAPYVQPNDRVGGCAILSAYFVVLGLFFALFLKINGRLLDRRAAGVSGSAALILAALFPFSTLAFGLLKTVLLCLLAAPLVGVGAFFYLQRLERIDRTEPAVPPALPAAPVLAALPAGLATEAQAACIIDTPQPVVVEAAPVEAAPESTPDSPVDVTEEAPMEAPMEAPVEAPVETPVETPPEPMKETPPTPRELVGEALAAAERKDFVRAVTLLTQALRRTPEPALQWVIVGELSNIYQHLGQYRLAGELIGAFLSAQHALDHPLVPVLRQKRAFCRSLDRLLIRRGTPNMSYTSVPEDLRRLAFEEALAARVA